MQTARYPEIPPDFGNWLAGFIDGEGCFYISRYERKSGPGFCPGFLLRVRDDDRPVIEEIQERTGLGSLLWERRDARSSSTRPNTHPAIGWRVVTRADCARLVELLDHYPLRAKKARDYAIWREAVLIWLSDSGKGYARIHGEGRDWRGVEELRRQLMEGRRYESPATPPALVEPEPRLFD